MQGTVGSNPTSSAQGRILGHNGPGMTVPGPTERPGAPPFEPSSGEVEAAAMRLALEEAAAAPAHGDVPVGAVVLAGGEVVARRHNERELTGDPTAHAELLALRDAAARLGRWRLSECTLVATLEPCPMCAGSLVAARVGRLVFGAADPKAGACGSLYNLCADPRLNHELAVVSGLMGETSAQLLVGFFASRRGAGPPGTTR